MIGICVIFLFADEWGKFLADQFIQELRKHTKGEYRIYGCAPRASSFYIDSLIHSSVNIIPSIEAPKNNHKLWNAMSGEHSYLLDILVTRAFNDGCEFVATFDMDSWPIMPGWDHFYSQMLSDEVPVATIVRTEFTDNFPCGAFTLLSRSFWTPGHSSFATDDLDRSLSRRPGETGSGILDQLANEGRSFLRLERTNDWNPHPIIAGLYDDAFFHLGAGSRTPRFVSDRRQYELNDSLIRRHFADDMNASARYSVLTMLRDSYDDFISELASGELATFEPTLTSAVGIPRTLTHAARSTRTRYACAEDPETSVRRFPTHTPPSRGPG